MFKTNSSKVTLFLLRIVMGWLMFYAGITKVLDPGWTAAGYLKSAKTFSAFYIWLTDPGIIDWVNFLNKWGLTLLGISLLLGILVRFSSVLGAGLMILYYWPVLDFPKAGEYGFIVDEHIIYALVLILFAVAAAGRFWGLDGCLVRKVKSRGLSLFS
jgi:thiosulfate dehydrogenase [quinone] large subunit